MTWSRQLAAAALAETLKDSAAAAAVTVFERPPATLNPPALVISRQSELAFGTAGFGVDTAQLPVVCVGPLEGEDLIDELVGLVCDAIELDPTLGAVVQSCTPNSTRSWRGVKIGGADMLALDLVLDFQM